MVELIEIIEHLNPSKVIGNTKKIVTTVIQSNEHNDDDQSLMWLGPKRMHQFEEIKAGIIICNSEPEEAFPNCTYLIVENPRYAFMQTLRAFFMPNETYTISPSAKIRESVNLGKDVHIGNNVVIEENVIIGDRVYIDHNTVIKKGTIIGNDCKIGCNCTIGAVGFGYEKDNAGNFIMIPHLGNVVINDHVEIGNNTCIDRAVLGSTLLNEHVKVDNLVHIAHGVEIGKNSLIIANAMVAGSVKIGENVWVAPSSSIINGKLVGDNAVIGLGAVVIKSVDDHQVIVGNPGKPLS